jgi:hydrogenase maturation protease
VTGRTLVAGVGNIFLADDGFGVEVVRRLAETPAPAGVEIADFGIRGVHLAYQLLEGYDTLVLIDAVARGERPGTVFLIEPDPGDGARAGEDPGRAGAPVPAGTPSIGDAHGLDPASVLALAGTLGVRPPRVLLVGCEPAELTERIGLSGIVAGAVDEAVRIVRSVLNESPAPPSGSAAPDRKIEAPGGLSCSSASSSPPSSSAPPSSS